MGRGAWEEAWKPSAGRGWWRGQQGTLWVEAQARARGDAGERDSVKGNLAVCPTPGSRCGRGMGPPVLFTCHIRMLKDEVLFHSRESEP